jgi:DNA-binding transcriptional regulator YdaS (Cro superfamily)
VRRDYWISKAIRYCGNQKKLAQRMGVKPERVSYLLNSARKISLETAVLIERATNGKVSRYQLLPHLNSALKEQLDGQPFFLRNLPISERVKQGIVYEEALKTQERKYFEQENSKNPASSCENFHTRKNRTSAIAAEYAALGNYRSYCDAKRVVESGNRALIQAMDEERIGISTAAKLTRYSMEEQQRILSLSRKEIIAYTKPIKKTASHQKLDFSEEMLILQIMLRGYFILKQQQFKEYL